MSPDDLGKRVQELAGSGIGSADLVDDQRYRQAVESAFVSLPEDDPDAADAFFDALILPQGFVMTGNPYRSLKAWIGLLDLLREIDEAKYSRIHKGTPFYFMAVAAYIAENFASALFYLDAAVSEDASLAPDEWQHRPAGLFLRLDPEPQKQFARPIVADARHQLEIDSGFVSGEGGPRLTPEILDERIIYQAVERDPNLRSVATALLTFLLEHRTRVTEFELSPRRGPGSGAACFLHLFLGALIFESLLRHSAVGAASGQTTLGGLVGDEDVASALGLSQEFRGFRSAGLHDVISWANGPDADSWTFPQRSMRITWGVRNTTGHALTWDEVNLSTYRNLYLWILCAISQAIDTLY